MIIELDCKKIPNEKKIFNLLAAIKGKKNLLERTLECSTDSEPEEDGTWVTQYLIIG